MENPFRKTSRLRVLIRGAVQGVGFRPFVYRLATELKLNGWVGNTSQGVTIEVEGEPANLKQFLLRIESDRPPRSFIQSMESSFHDPKDLTAFEIRESTSDGKPSAIVLPDIATCPDCLKEISDPHDRRYRYPFTNCTNCGPRYSIIKALPYDRPNTSMERFQMCAKCRSEYDDPFDRRFHAQPNACPECGPQIALWDAEGQIIASENDALGVAATAIRMGKILAIKGLGGFHLMVDAANDDAIRLLRKRKNRQEKPLALMVPDLEQIEDLCEVSGLERRALESPEKPIVILRSRFRAGTISNYVAPNNPYLGCMLPYTPLHHLLAKELGFPIVASSGNLSDEPICFDEIEALTRLNGIADLFLVHDRGIVRHVDDSIVRVMAGREMVIRRARGFAPLPFELNESCEPMIAVGAQMKNTVAATSGKQSFVSQHIGDLATSQASTAFREVMGSIEGLYDISPTLVASDKHPDYVSTRFAVESGLPRIEIQHHYAHALSCMVDNELDPPLLAVVWDGTGYGDDGTIWGGEFLRVDSDGYSRSAHFRTFPLPGGSIVAREPRRSAIGVIYENTGHLPVELERVDSLGAFDPNVLALILKMVGRGINSPVTSSVGRLFDAVASLAGIRQTTDFEGQAAMELEFAIGALQTDERYDANLLFSPGEPAVVDWGPAISDIIADVQSGVCRALISARFHNMLAETIVRVAGFVGEDSVVLTGGCFQNKYLLERSVKRLSEVGFRPYWHQRIPTNDGGIALGQTIAASRTLRRTKSFRSVAERRNSICV